MVSKSIRYLTWFVVVATAIATCQQQPPPTIQERLGYPASARLLIIHADDVGMFHSVNRATFEALEKGWITSASILVPCPWFPEAARWARAHPQADLGLHLALTSEWTDVRWGPVAPADKVPSLLDQDGYLYLDTPMLAHVKMPEVETELRSQIERARTAGVRFTHLDTHMAALASSPELFTVYQRLGREYNVPILSEKGETFRVPPGVSLADNEMLVQKVIGMEPGIDRKDWLKWYENALAPLPPGVYQLIVHLGYDDEEIQGATWNHPDWGAAWRQSDFDMVRSPEFQSFLRDQKLRLIRWSDLQKIASRFRAASR